jgi:uncharacterized protein YndB with AHSA1/START domain
VSEPDYNSVVVIDINTPVDKVWEALTNPSMVKKYLHDTDMVTDWKVGSPIVWKGSWNGKAYEDKGTVLVFEPSKRLSTTHFSPLTGKEDKPENYHTVTYELSQSGNGTRLTLTQSNNPTQEAADKMAENGWRPVLNTMKSLLES